MKSKKLLLLLAVAALVLGLAAGAWAAPAAGGPDKVTLTNIVTNPTSTIGGNNVNVTGTVNAGDPISLSFTVGVSATGPTSSTSYPHSMPITASTNIKPDGASDVIVTGLTTPVTLNRTGTGSTATESATLTAPATAGAYQVRIDAADGINGSGAMTGDFFFVNFTVAESGCTPAATTLVLSEPECVLYHAPSVSLSATLKSDVTPLVGKTITFYVDGDVVGTADTDSSGVATLTYNPSSLSVGDHALSAAWDNSNDPCYQSPTVTGAKLGVQYLFLGFQQPINGDGSSLFGGRTIPVKIKLADYNGVTVPDATCYVYYHFQTPAMVGTDAEPLANTNADSGNTMRYDPVAQQYIFNWDIAGLYNGAYWIIVGMGEGTCASQRTVLVTLKKKGSK